MDRQQIGTCLVMRLLGLNVSMKSFDDRLVLQKAIHLAQAAGVNLGYQFHWYLRGPYCSVLTRDGFSIVEETTGGDDESKHWCLDKNAIGRLKNLRKLTDKAPPSERAHHLELLASVQFLVGRHQASAEPDAIHTLLKEYRKDFSLAEVKRALKDLSDHGLLGPS